MSLAARVKARKLAGGTFDFEARRRRLAAAQERVAEAAAAEAATVLGAGPDGPLVATAARKPSPAKRHALKVAAAAIEANDVQDGGAPLSAYDHMLVQLHNDRKRLKEIKATEAKIALKRELLPSYLPWVQGRLEAASGGARGAQDDVMVAIMIWAIDIGDHRFALELADWCRRWSPVLPSNIQRDLPNFVTEEIADAALRAFKAGGDAAAAFPGGVLGDVEEMFRDDDMFDEVRGKLQKAIGLAVLAAAPADAPAEQLAPIQRDALGFFRRAQEIDPKAGCSKLIEKLERELKKLNPGDPDGAS